VNTPKPCDTCKHCKYDVMHEDNPLSTACCEYDLIMGIQCSAWEHWDDILGHISSNHVIQLLRNKKHRRLKLSKKLIDQ
jgi:hypothetical protein